MSFAYKKIPPNDINVNINNVNKLYKYDNLSDINIDIFVGENIPLNNINILQLENYNINTFTQTGLFDPINDDKTSNDEYKRLVFESIKHLYYKEFIGNSGSLISSSRYEYYPQTTLYSGTYSTNIRSLENIQGLSYQYINNIYNNNVIYDSTFLYDDASYEINRGNLISVLSISKNIYGSKIQPNTFLFLSSSVYIRDDGEGNILDYNNEDNYNSYISTGNITGNYIGNILYSQGLIVITNPFYICTFGVPPVAVNDYYSINNLNPQPFYDILANDYSDCGLINFNSIDLIPIPGYTFPTNYIDNGFLYIVDDQSSYIPGLYKLGYQIINNENINSNTGIITLEIKSKPLNIDLNYNKICSGSGDPINFTLNINDGVPSYSYSWDDINYTQIPTFLSASLTGSINELSSSLYIKDYIGNTLITPISPYYNYDYELELTNSSVCTSTGSINLITNETGSLYDIDGSGFIYNPNTVYNISNGVHSLTILTSQGCNINTNFEIYNISPVSYDIITSSISCYGGSDGTIEIINVSGGLPPYNYHIYNISSSISSSYSEYLSAGTYNIKIIDSNCEYTSSIILPENSQISSSIENIYSTECYSSIEFSTTGGIPPYNYTVISPANIYNDDNDLIQLSFDDISELTLTCSIQDSIGCSITKYHTVYGREWLYSSSYCEEV